MTDTIVLPEKLDTTAATSLYATLQSSRGKPLRADASRSASIGALCTQILLAAQVTWQAEGHSFTLTGTAQIASDLALLGASDLLLISESAS